MEKKIGICLLFISSLLAGCSFQQMNQSRQSRAASSNYEQIDLHALVKRYMKKDKFNAIEGIYSVSGSVTKKGKGLMGNAEKEKTTDRKENYAQVAIMRDPEDTGRDYIELSIDKENLTSYSIVGQFNKATTGNILVYKHIDPKSKTSSFTFTTDEKAEVLEGIRVENEGNTTVTYKLTYLKIYPK